MQSMLIILLYIFMPPFEQEGVYCFANVGQSVDQMVSSDYLKYHLSQYFTCRLLMTSRWPLLILGSKVKVRGAYVSYDISCCFFFCGGGSGSLFCVVTTFQISCVGLWTVHVISKFESWPWHMIFHDNSIMSWSQSLFTSVSESLIWRILQCCTGINSGPH